MSEKNSGIYYIQNTVTKQLYIGQTSNLQKRKGNHLSMLKNNSHFNKHLQRSFNKYGIENFEFRVIEYCDSSKLLELEKAYVDFFNTKKHGFNMKDGGDVPPDNSNEKHGMWREDISNERIKEMYLGDYNSTEISEYFNCSRRTINRRLRKIFGDEYDVLKLEKQRKKLKETASQDPNICTDDIVKLANQGYNSVEIAKELGCSDSTVMWRLRKVYTLEQYEEYKQRNMIKKMGELQAKAHVPEKIKLAADNRKKYSLWDGSHVHYNKTGSKDWNSTFYVRFNARDVPTGKFIDFVSPQIVYDLICDFS